MSAATSDKPKFRILLVEDEDFLRRIFKLRLNAEGYEVSDASTGEAAWEWLRENVPHLVILDLYLPRMSGFELLQLLKADPKLKNTPVLVLSGLGQEADIRKGLELGAQEYVTKTKLKPSEFLAKVRNLLEPTPAPPPL